MYVRCLPSRSIPPSYTFGVFVPVTTDSTTGPKTAKAVPTQPWRTRLHAYLKQFRLYRWLLNVGWAIRCADWGFRSCLVALLVATGLVTIASVWGTRIIFALESYDLLAVGAGTIIGFALSAFTEVLGCHLGWKPFDRFALYGCLGILLPGFAAFGGCMGLAPESSSLRPLPAYFIAFGALAGGAFLGYVFGLLLTNAADNSKYHR